MRHVRNGGGRASQKRVRRDRTPVREIRSGQVWAMIKRGEIYFVSLDPVNGREQAGNRPVLVVSSDAINAQPLVVTVGAYTRRVDRQSTALFTPTNREFAIQPKRCRNSKTESGEPEIIRFRHTGRRRKGQPQNAVGLRQQKASIRWVGREECSLRAPGCDQGRCQGGWIDFP